MSLLHGDVAPGCHLRSRKRFPEIWFLVRSLPPKPVADTARGSCSSWTLPRTRLAARSLAARQCFHCTCRSTGRLACLNCATAALFGCSEETQTTLRRHPCCDAHGRLRECPSVRSPREWRASGDRNMPKPIIPNRPASSRCAPIAETARTAKPGRSASPRGQAQQARRPSTQTSKHLAAQPSSASERQDKEAACGPHPGMDSIAYRWYRGVEGPVFSTAGSP